MSATAVAIQAVLFDKHGTLSDLHASWMGAGMRVAVSRGAARACDLRALAEHVNSDLHALARLPDELPAHIRRTTRSAGAGGR
jgi:phosphoglycolate phosphatase-like HAD superfamily hydrolase